MEPNALLAEEGGISQREMTGGVSEISFANILVSVTYIGNSVEEWLSQSVIPTTMAM